MDRSQLPPRLARLAHLDQHHCHRHGHEDARPDGNSNGSGTRRGKCCCCYYDRSLDSCPACGDGDGNSDDDGGGTGYSVARARQQALMRLRSLVSFYCSSLCVYTLRAHHMYQSFILYL